MRVKQKFWKLYWIGAMLMLLLGMMSTDMNAQENALSYQKGANHINVSFDPSSATYNQVQQDVYLWSKSQATYGEMWVTIGYSYDFSSQEADENNVTIKSSDTDVAYFESDSIYMGSYGRPYGSSSGSGSSSKSLVVKKPGKTTVTISVGEKSISKTIYIVPQAVQNQKVTQKNASTYQISWTAIPEMDGYLIRRGTIEQKKDQYGFLSAQIPKVKTIARVAGGSTSQITLDVDTFDNCCYEVVGYMLKDGVVTTKTLDEKYTYVSSDLLQFQVKQNQGFLTSVKKKTATSVQLSWQMDGAQSSTIYRKVGEKGAYKEIKTGLDAKTSTYVDNVTAGKLYFYRIEKTYKSGLKVTSKEKIGYVPVKTKKAQIETQQKIKQQYGYGQYSGNWAHPDSTYYYEQKGNFVVVNRSGNNLEIVTLDANMKYKKKKTVKLGSFDYFGGVYAAADNNFYVAVGFDNSQEAKNKTVIKVYKYDKNWKKKKTCNIKSNAKNSFDGIVQPFRGGNCKMTLVGDTLYLFSCRTMFKHSDGLNHQSNIAFQIDTKKMTYKNENQSYTSHSFNQYVDYQDGSLYLVDHGDAYPRALKLTIVDGYQTKSEKKESYNLFNFEGAIGANYTGATVGGMAIGAKKILVCGTSLPQNKKVAGVKGNTGCVTQNVFVTVTDRETGKTSFKWITQLNPKSAAVKVGETRIIRIKDDRFVLLYTTTKGQKQTLNYMVLSESGKVVKKKTYSSVLFDASSQPILYNGFIQWTAAAYEGSGWFGGNTVTKSYRIPVQF